MSLVLNIVRTRLEAGVALAMDGAGGQQEYTLFVRIFGDQRRFLRSFHRNSVLAPLVSET